ncbi:MAG: DUF5996 family protein [Acidobacteriia bacterium]|nr:DUF5996 family protein [Terriglobia bacterium]
MDSFRSAPAENPTWPPLPLEEWAATYATVHMWTQIVGKVRLALSPHWNHWWETPLYVSARGLSTTLIPYGERAFEMEFDFIDHNLALRGSDRAARYIPLYARSVADFYREFMAVLGATGIEVKIWPHPVEVPDPIPFPDDVQHAAYDPEYVGRFHRVLLQADAAFKEFRAGFLGKASPVHFFWGSFDLAVTRFSGRRAPERQGADAVTRDAYSHECSSVGFWPGGGGVSGPAFYSYAAPEPEGFSSALVRPAAAHYDQNLHELILMYDEVRRAPRPKAALLEFCQSAYEAAATLGGWERASLERAAPERSS